MSGDERQPTAGGPVEIQVISGFPLIDRATEIYRGMLGQAGMAGAEVAHPPEVRPEWKSSFHIAIDGSGTVLGVLHARIGRLSELFLAETVDPDQRLAEPICECPSLAVDPAATGMGITELLYRSVYCFARRHGAGSLVTALDAVTVELFRQDYGVTFRPLGPVSTRFGYELMPVGEDLVVLEDEVRRRRPEFLAFLTEPFTATERVRFGL